MSEAARTLLPANHYLQYMEHLNPDISEMDELFYQENDLDNDGNMEIIAAFGHKYTDENEIAACFVLRNNDGKIQLVGKDFCIEGYWPAAMQLVKFTGSDQTYIAVNVTNGLNLNGLYIYEVNGNSVNHIGGKASATGAGNTYLDNKLNDGSYGGFTYSQWSYDVLYYPVTTFYSFQNGAFVQQTSIVDVRDYPESPADAVIQWLSLKELSQNYNSDDIKTRLNEIGGSVDHNMSNIDWYSALFNYIMDFEPSNEDYQNTFMNVNETTKGQTSTIAVSVTDQDNKELTAVTFSLSLCDGKWHIDSINAASKML